MFTSNKLLDIEVKLLRIKNDRRKTLARISRESLQFYGEW